jgi:uncharacterized ion transporter superfamily protein YfcC
MLLVILIAMAMTYLVGAGQFDWHDGKVVPDSYHTVDKQWCPAWMCRENAPTDSVRAHPATPISALREIPEGLKANAALIFLVMIIGGMFGVVRQTGALDAGVDALLAASRGRLAIVLPVLMLLLASGSTVLGFISEYLAIIPMIVLLTARLGLPSLIAAALVIVPAKVGYLASVSNPLVLAVAQPIAGVPLFSGTGLRLLAFVLFLLVGILFVLHRIARMHRESQAGPVSDLSARVPMTARQRGVLLVLAAAAVGLIAGVKWLHWGDIELAAFYLAVSLCAAWVGGERMSAAADVFLDGMRGMVLAGLLIGLAASVERILRDGMVLDSLIHGATQMVHGQSPGFVACSLMVIEMAIDVLIPSLSGKAAVSMPIISPIAQMRGVSGQVAVLALLFGGGLMNMITPTSGMLLAYLAAAKVGWGQWLRFVWPLFALYTALALVILWGAAALHYA